jgi:GNAT superfamily N-acetyltransferase
MPNKVTAVSIQDISPGDAGVLAGIQRASSIAALGHIFPPERYPFPIDAVRERWRTFAGQVLLASVDGFPVGFAGLEPPSLEGLYVVPEAWGTGVAGTLHDRAVESLAAAGAYHAHLWVLEHNVRARRFYERRGWRADGTSRVVPFPPHPIDVGYTRTLDSSSVVAR